MKGETIFKGHFVQGEERVIELASFRPIGEKKGDVDVFYSFDGQTFFPNPALNQTALFLKIRAKLDTDVEVLEGDGFVVTKDEGLSKKFEHSHIWSGADGIYSFNLCRKEDYNQKDDPTLFLFGDTFIGESLPSKKRLEPTKMVNNTVCYKKGDAYDFFVNRDENGAFISCFEVPFPLTKIGYLAENLTRDLGKQIPQNPYLSSLGEKDNPVLTFDLHGRYALKAIAIANFFDDSYGLEESYRRGAREVRLSFSLDGIHYIHHSTLKLNENQSGHLSEQFLLDGMEAAFVRLELIRKEGLTPSDDCVGLNQVLFFDEEGLLSDVACFSNSLSAFETVKSWFWLQDGFVKDDTFYVYPEIVQEELNGIEGFEFKIAGVVEAKIPLKNGRLEWEKVSIRQVPFYLLEDDCETILGSAVLDNRDQDGYLYFYGYRNDRKNFLRSMIVSRIREEDLGNYNELRYFDGEGWSRDIRKAKALIPHVSTEMSVIPLKEGPWKGKYLANFEYDSIGKWTCYCVMDTPFGPFGPVCPIYYTPELDRYTKTTYTYNAKAHLHLSEPSKILVSYNVNDMSMKANKDDYTIYHPRFLWLTPNSTL